MTTTCNAPQRFGPQALPGSTRFSLWAPGATQVELILTPLGAEPRRVAMQPCEEGFFVLELADVGPGARYYFARDGGPLLPDPASRFQPEGVHGPSEVVGLSAHRWRDDGWRGLAPEQLVIYELHVGTFSPAGDYRGLEQRLDHLAALGATALEVMPLAAFAGQRNWGYDGVFHFAPFAGYGRPEELMALVDACHQRGLAVILDLVTNHFGTEGNAMWNLAPAFFRPDRPTAWAAGINWPAEPVLDYFAEVARFWIADYHFDGLRLDAFHAVPEEARAPHLRRMVEAIDGRLGPGTERQAFVLLESIGNQVSLLHAATPRVRLAQLNFDWQRATHALLTGERHGAYADFAQADEELGRCAERGFAFRGRYSQHHGYVRGESQAPSCWDEVVNFIQNHDTAGNRYLGERLDALVEQEDALRAATAMLLLHPAPPFLFMGQEWGARTPFHFFTDLPQELGELAQQGRLRGFSEMGPVPWSQSAPACQELEAFTRSKLHWEELAEPRHQRHLDFVAQLLAVRRQIIPLLSRDVAGLQLERQGACYLMRLAARQADSPDWLLAANLSSSALPFASEGNRLVYSSRAEEPEADVVPAYTTQLYAPTALKVPDALS